jgi:multiple sugar transport system permease protein
MDGVIMDGQAFDDDQLSRSILILFIHDSKGPPMTVEAVYLLGSLCVWIGAGFLLRAAFLGASAWLGLPQQRGRSSRGALVALATGAALLIVSTTLRLDLGRPAAGTRLPIAWVYMVFPGWMMLLAVAMAVRSVLNTLSQLTPEQTARQWRWAAVWVVFGLANGWWFKAVGGRAWIFRGYIPAEPPLVVGFVALATLTIVAMVAAQRWAVARDWGRVGAITLALVVGSALFAVPLGWQILTSFKEERDQTTANGFIWVPQVQDVHAFDDPKHPLVDATFDGTPVKAQVIGQLGEGRVFLEVERPYSLRGRRTEAKPGEFKPILREALVFQGKYRGQSVKAFVTEEAENGVKTLEVLEPPSIKGQSFQAPTSELEPVRHVALRWQNYTEALEWLPQETRGGLVYVQNTLVLVVLKVLATLVSCSLVAYGFARLRFPGRDIMFTIMLSTMMLPSAVTMMPQFLIFRSLGWIDTLQPLWAPSLFAGAFYVFLLRQFFSTIPHELEEAARIDGCGYFRTFWQVMLPQIQPALAAIGVWTFMATWNDFMGPLIYISSPEKMPLVYALAMYNADRGADVGLLMAFSTMALTPLLILFFFAQRFFTEGVQLAGLGGR